MRLQWCETTPEWVSFYRLPSVPPRRSGRDWINHWCREPIVILTANTATTLLNTLQLCLLFLQRWFYSWRHWGPSQGRLYSDSCSFSAPQRPHAANSYLACGHKSAKKPEYKPRGCVIFSHNNFVVLRWQCTARNFTSGANLGLYLWVLFDSLNGYHVIFQITNRS